MSPSARQRACIYTRTSDATDPSAATLDSQEAACRAWCDQQGAEVVAIYRENYTGVDLWSRPALQTLLAEAQKGAYDLVVYYAADRLSRDPEHLTTLKVMLAFGGARLACVTEPIAEDETGTLVQFVRGWAAKREWSQIRERTLRGKRARAERGLVPGAGTDLYGYRKDRELGVRTIYEPEARIVRRIYQWLNDGLSLRAIETRLNDEGVPSPASGKISGRSSARWGNVQIRRIARNPAYQGEAYAFTWRWDPARNAMVERPRSEWIALPEGAVPRIVSEELWQAAQRRLDTNRGEWTRNQVHWRRYLLRGLITCGICGRRLYPNPAMGYRYYRCSSWQRPGGACGLGSVRADLIEADIWTRVCRFVQDPAVIQRAQRLERPDDTGQIEREIGSAEARIAQIVAGQERLIARFRQSETVRWELIERELARAERERQVEERQLADLQRQLADRRLSAQRVIDLTVWCGRVAVNLERLEFDEQRLVLERLGVRVTAVDRETWEILPRWL